MDNNKSLTNSESNSQHDVSWAYLDQLGIGISWAWKNWVPNGFLSLIVGGVGLGKSTIVLRIGASFLTGMDWLDGSPYTDDTGYVVWCEAESGQFMNIDRAKRWGLPLEYLVSPLENAYEDFNLSNINHKECLEKRAYKNDVKLIVIDSFRGAIEGDENKSETSKELKYLAHLAQDSQKPIIMVHHLRKKSVHESSESVDLDSVRGNSSIVQFPRTVIALNTPNPNFPDKRKLEVIKNNLGKYPDPIGITITDHGIDVVEEFDRYAKPRNITQRDLAKAFLKDYLKDGYKPSTIVFEASAEKSINQQTLERAKKDLGIVARKEGKIWVWEFPPDG